MGKVFHSAKAKEKKLESNIEVNEEDVRRADAILTGEMDQEILKRLRKEDTL